MVGVSSRRRDDYWLGWLELGGASSTQAVNCWARRQIRTGTVGTGVTTEHRGDFSSENDWGEIDCWLRTVGTSWEATQVVNCWARRRMRTIETSKDGALRRE